MSRRAETGPELKRVTRSKIIALAISGLIVISITAAKPKPKEQPNPGASPQQSIDVKANPDAAYALRVVQALADPTMEGRGAGTAGIDSAANFIAREMRTLGLKPGGEDGSYFQNFEVTTGVAVGEPCAIEVGGKRYGLGADFQPVGFSSNGTLTAPVVFAGYGITAPGYDYDDYKGIDARDKIVLVFTNEPGEMDSTSKFDGSINTPHSELRTKAINAREHGALGMLVVHGPRHHSGEPLREPRREGGAYMTSGLSAGLVSETVAAALLAPAKLDLVTLQNQIDRSVQPHSQPLGDSATVTVTLKRTRASIRNVIGWIPGRDTARTLVVGAHYDHLGFGGENSLTPDSHLPHLGADDNASGVAGLLTIARWEARRRMQPAHNLVFCAFAGEEMGLVGSSHYVDDPTRPLETVEAMFNMDMIGRLRDNKLMVMGVGTAAEFPALLDSIDNGKGFDIKTSSDGYGPSDHSSFYKRKVPVIAMFTGAHAEYHKPTDRPELINAGGLVRVASLMRDMLDALDRSPRPTYQQARADSTMGRIAGGGGYGAYLGTIPDYMQTEGGVLLSGVRAGSPADSAGLKGGDVIVKFDGVRVDNIYDYTFALRSRKPGRQVRIGVKRGDNEIELLAVLGRRK